MTIIGELEERHLPMVSSKKPPQMIRPAQIPTNPTKLTSIDMSMLYYPPVTVHNIFHGKLDVPKLKESFIRLLNKNPILAGRVRSTQKDANGNAESCEVFFDEDLCGCPFHVDTLDANIEDELDEYSPEEIARYPLQWEIMVEKLGIKTASLGSSTVDRDEPICSVCYIKGRSMSILTLSICHLIVDGSAYFQLLKLWDDEFSNPGCAVEMLSRQAVESVDQEFKAKYTKWEQDALAKFYPDLFTKGYMERDLLEHYQVCVHISDECLKKLKEAQAAELAKSGQSGAIFSTQDSLIAFIANHTLSRWYSFTVDMRGRSPNLPQEVLGNAFQTWYGTPKGGPGNTNALDVRQSIRNSGTNIRPALEHALATGLDWSVDVNSWLKLQYFPRFDSKLKCQVRAIGRSGLPFMFRMNYHMIYQLKQGHYIQYHWGLQASEAKMLKQAWKDLGVKSVTVTSGSRLVDFFEKGDSSKSALDSQPFSSWTNFPGISGGGLSEFRKKYQDFRAGRTNKQQREYPVQTLQRSKSFN